MREMASSQNTTQNTYNVKLAKGEELINLYYSTIYFYCTHMLRPAIHNVTKMGTIRMKYHSISHLKRILGSSFKYAASSAFLNQTNSLRSVYCSHSYALFIKEGKHGQNHNICRYIN
jgi:hypothetical protein